MNSKNCNPDGGSARELLLIAKRDEIRAETLNGQNLARDGRNEGHMIGEEALAFAAAFEAEHREMRQLVVALRDAINHRNRPWSREVAREAVEAVEAMRVHLHHHFAQEEAGGYLEQALAMAPRFHDEAQTLLAQHAAMLHYIDEVAETAKSSVDDAELWSQVKLQVKDLLRKLVAHESAENRIVQQAFNVGTEAE